MRLLLPLAASLFLLSPSAAALPWLLPETPVPLPMGYDCGVNVGPLGLNCASYIGEGGGGACTPVRGGQECTFEFAITIESSWWKNAGGLEARLDGSCKALTIVAWDMPFVERTDEARCSGTFFVPDRGCGEVEVGMRVAFLGLDAPEEFHSGMGMGVCTPG